MMMEGTIMIEFYNMLKLCFTMVFMLQNLHFFDVGNTPAILLEHTLHALSQDDLSS